VNQTPRSVLDPTIPMTLLGRADEVIDAPFAVRQLAVAKCRFGSSASDLRHPLDVRFSPESDHIAGRTPLLFASTIAAVDFPFDCGVR
jgi:hypothetical protein